MKMKSVLTFLVVCSFIIYGCENKVQTTALDKPVKVFVSWPGGEALPHYVWNKDSDKPEGIEPDLIELILKHAGLEYTYISNYNSKTGTDPRITAITSGKADVSIRGITITPSRSELVDFSMPYYQDGIGALVKRTSIINSVNDLKGKKVYAVDFTTAYSWAQKNLTSSALICHKEDSIYISPEQLLEIDSIDAFLIDYTFLKYQSKRHQSLRVLDQKLTVEPLGIAVSKKNPALLIKINNSIRALSKSGELQKVIERFDK